MKRGISAFLILILMSVGLPVAEVYAGANLSPSGTTEIGAAANDGDYDASAGRSGIPVEAGNLSFNQDDYVIFNVFASKKTEYAVDFLIGCPPGSAPIFDIYVDDTLIESVPISTGADWLDYHQNNTLGNIALTSGSHTVKIVNSSPYGVYFRGIIFDSKAKPSRLITTGPYKEVTLPAVIEAENFDLGRDGVKSADGVNQGKKYRPDDGIDIYDNNAGGYYVDIGKTEAVRYTFRVPYEGAYTLWFGPNAIGTANLYFDDAPNPIGAELSGSLTETKINCIYFEKGEHSVRVEAQSSRFQFDWFRFSQGGENAVTLASLWEDKTQEDKPEDGEKEHSIYKTFYVSENGSDTGDGSETAPFLTLFKAKEAIAAVNDAMTGDIVVNVMSGSYYLPETLQFTPEEGGKNGYRVTIQGYDNSTPPIIHGGKRVTGWTEYKNGIYKAPLDVEFLRNLYVDGQPMVRARSKYMYTVQEMYSTAKVKNEGFKVDAANFPQFSKPSELETVWPLTWFTQRLLVTDITRTEKDVTVHMQQPKFAMSLGTETIETIYGKGFFLENALELLDEPGEFYYSRDEKQIYFYPYREQNLDTAEVYAPATEYLIDVNGTDKTNKVKNITFKNLDFRYGAWNDTSKEGFKGTQASCLLKVEDGKKVNYTMPAQIAVNRAENVMIQDCRFSCMSGNALGMEDAVSASKVEGCAFWNLGGMGVVIDTFEHDPAFNNGSKNIADMEQCRDITVTNNLFRRVALEYYGCVAIHAYYPKDLKVYHNDIADVPYTGMSVGWGWGGEKLTDCCFDVSYNKVIGVNEYLADGGNLYTLGETTGSVVSYNYFASNGDSRGGVYNDSGSANIDIFKNVFEDVSRWWVQGMYHTEFLTAHDNFSERIDIYDVPANGNTRPDELLEKGHTLVPNGKWTGEAAEIAENAGLEEKYKPLLTVIEFPEWMANPITNVPKTDFDSSRLNWIQAEDYMRGGEGVGYHKINPIYASAYRPLEGVDLYKDYTSTAMGYVVGTDFDGEWWAYEVDVSEDGEYAIDIRAAQAGWASGVDVYVDNVKAGEGILLTDDTSFWKHNLTRVAIVQMTKGRHIVKIEINGGSFFFDAVAVTPSGVPLHAPAGTIDEGTVVSYETFTKEKINSYKKEKISFEDTQKHWAEKEILHLAESGIITGVASELFAPEGRLTKGQAVRLVLRALKLVYNEETEQNWFVLAEQNGYLKNGEENEEITREAFAEMLTNAIIYKQGKCLVDVAKGAFADDAEIDSAYKLSVISVANAGLMIGDENQKFHPKKTLTRAEAAVVIQRLIYT